MKKLTEIDHVDLFLICLKGNINRITNSLCYMMKLFRDIFGHKLDRDGIYLCDPNVFWNRCIIALNQVRMDHKEIKRRLRTQNQMTDDQLAERNVHDLNDYFDIKGIHLEHVFIDSFYDEEDPVEKEKFEESTEKLYQMLEKKSLSPAMTKGMLDAYNELRKGRNLLFNLYQCSS